MEAELTPEDKTTIAALLRDMIAADRFPLSPRIRELRAILAKLVPPPAALEPMPPPSAGTQGAG